MQIHTTARHFELAAEDRTFAHSRMEKFGRYASDLHEIHLVVTAESYRYVAEATLRLKKRDLAVREEATEPRRAIDRVADRAEQQLRRLHDRRTDRRDGRADDLANGAAAGTAGDAGDGEADVFEDDGED